MNTDTPKYGHEPGQDPGDDDRVSGPANQMVEISDVHLEALVQAAQWRYTEPIGRDEETGLRLATTAAQRILDALKPRCGAYFYPDSERCLSVKGHEGQHESAKFVWQAKP